MAVNLLTARAGVGLELDQRLDLARSITAEGLESHLVVLGSDALEGRAAGTRGGGRAASYIARQLRKAGLSPMGDRGTFFQMVPLHAARPRADCRLQLSSLGQTRTLRLGEDYQLLTTGDQTIIPRPVPMVFVGYGIVAPEHDYNDYEDVDVRGRVVVFLGGEPSSDDPDYFDGRRPSVYSSLEAKQRIALSRGAVGSVLVPLVAEDEAQTWSDMARELSVEHLSLAYSVPRHLSLVLRPRSAAELFADALYDLPQVLEMELRYTLRSFYLPVSLRFEGSFDQRDVMAPNVVGLIRGSHRRYGDTYVVVSAHYDHLGIGPELDGDSIYNGVIDNALGVSGVLEMARAVAAAERSPRRSIIFLLTTAEEEGTLGASYFLDHPPVSLDRIIANINVDGLAFLSAFDDVFGIGGELSDLGDALERAAESMELEVSQPPAELWSSESFSRSDQIAFAEAGVPSILINEGFSWPGVSEQDAIERSAAWFVERYHTPFDDLAQPLDLEASAVHARLVLALVLEAAESARAPSWHPGVRYAYQRLLSTAGARR